MRQIISTISRYDRNQNIISGTFHKMYRILQRAKCFLMSLGIRHSTYSDHQSIRRISYSVVLSPFFSHYSCNGNFYFSCGILSAWYTWECKFSERREKQVKNKTSRVSVSKADPRFDLSFSAEYRPAAENEFTFRPFGEAPMESGLVCKPTPVTLT